MFFLERLKVGYPLRKGICITITGIVLVLFPMATMNEEIHYDLGQWKTDTNLIEWCNGYANVDTIANVIANKFKYSNMSIEEISHVIYYLSSRKNIRSIDIGMVGILAIIARESSWISTAKNRNSSALGLMQVIKGTCESMGFKYEDMLNPIVSINAGMCYINMTSKVFSGERLIISYSSWREAYAHKEGNYHIFVSKYNEEIEYLRNNIVELNTNRKWIR